MSDMDSGDVLLAWANLRPLLSTDKSNDWTEEIVQMDLALGFDGECGECKQPFVETELIAWPHANPPVLLCYACEHDARRSGWEPGQ